jgi:signal transduction histidine kinase
VTEHRRALERLAQGEEVIRRLYEIAAEHRSDLHTRLEKLLELGNGLFRMQTGIVSRVAGGTFEVVEVLGGPSQFARGMVTDLGYTYCEKTVAAGEPVALSRASGTEWEGHAGHRQNKQEAYIGAPVVVDGDVFGTLSFTSLEALPEGLTERDRELVRLMALWVGREIEVEQNSDLARLLSLGREALTGSFDAPGIREIVGRLAVPALAEVSVLYLPLGEGRILRSQFVSSSGLTEEETSVDALLHREGSPHPPLETLRQAASPRTIRLGGREASDDIEWLRATGHSAALIVPVAAQSGVIAAQVLFSSDLSHFDAHARTIARELATLTGFALSQGQAREAAEGAVRARDDLLAFVSHDLGNPIATISMVTERLLGKPPAEDRREETRFYLEGIRDSVNRMERLVHDLLEVQTLEGGHRRINPAPVLAKSIVLDILREFRHAADTKSLQLHGDGDEGALVLADRDRLMEVLSNLLDNAVKFSAPGGSIRVAAERGDANVLFSVSDSGSGVPAERIPNLFNRYVQASEKRRAGAGLGLAIAKQIVEQHGGSIWCESEVGIGAAFRFTIPAP